MTPPTDAARSSRTAALAFTALVAAPALLGSRFSVREPATAAWYRRLRKPPFQPPPAVFGPVWSALYSMIGIAGYRVWASPPSPDRDRALRWWAAQLAANAAWSPTFFGAKAPRASLGLVGVQGASSAAFVAAARDVDRPAAWLFAPHLAWTAFAGVLNEEIVRRNPTA
jgi:tryptophan-rich sensory protein